jgi:hypothetical protein
MMMIKKVDEVFFKLKPDEEFYNNMKLYAAAKGTSNIRLQIIIQKRYIRIKAEKYERNLKKWLNDK